MTSAGPDPFRLTGKTVLVTGASSGIGAATCAAVAAAGGTVWATGRDTGRLATVVGGLPGEGHRSVPADLTEDDARARLVETAGSGGLDGVVHCAGISPLAPVVALHPRRLREALAVNFEAPLLLTGALLKGRRLRDGASLVFIASIVALQGAGAGAYAAYAGSKGALVAAVRSLALEVAPRRIRANCIAPGWVDTPMTEAVAENFLPGALDAHRQSYPLGTGTPDDVAHAAVFLLADSARWITGTTLAADGGFCVGK